jgi:hypothetical protein
MHVENTGLGCKYVIKVKLGHNEQLGTGQLLNSENKKNEENKV